MVITDHNTYNGYRYWKHNIKGKRHTDFVVLKGIEYDTRDAGHMLVIMPEGVKMRLLELRGMRASVLIDLVASKRRGYRSSTSIWRKISDFCQYKTVL